MNIDDIWRENLEGLLTQYGGPKELADEIAKGPHGKNDTVWSANYLTQLRSAEKSFGKKVARGFETKLKLPQGWMNSRQFAEPHATDSKQPGAGAAGKKADPDVQYANHVRALQMALRSMAVALVEHLPAGAERFAGHLQAQADKARFSFDRGLVSEVIGIVREDRQKVAAARRRP